MEKDINKKIQERIADAEKLKKGIIFDWFKRFFDMLCTAGVSDEIILKTMENSLSPEGLERITAKGNSEGFFNNKQSKEAVDKFFEYMKMMAQRYGKDKFKDFLENTLLQIADEYEEYKKFGHSKRTTLKNLFLKHLVLENPKDVIIEYSGTPIEKMSADDYSSLILLKIAGMEICDIKFEEAKGNPPIILFTDFHTLNGLEKMGLGKHLFIEFCKQMAIHKPGQPVMAWNVMKGRDGEKVYSKWGAYPVRVYVDNDFWEIDTTSLSDEEVNDFYGEHARIYYFSPEKIKELSEQLDKRYGKQRKTEKCVL